MKRAINEFSRGQLDEAASDQRPRQHARRRDQGRHQGVRGKAVAEILKRSASFLTSPRSFAGRGGSRSAAKAPGEGRGSAVNTIDDFRVVLVALKAFRPGRFCIWRAQCLAPHPAHALPLLVSGARLLQARTRNRNVGVASRFRVRRDRAARCAIRSRRRNDGRVAAFSRRNASEVCQSLANRARGWSGGGARVLARHPWRRVVSPPRAARQPRAPKARRSASQRSTVPPGIDRPGPPVRPALASSTEGSPLESAPSSDRTRSG